MKNKLLLCSVFGPYGVKDEYAEALGMQMELLDNQVTRGQSIHSPRQSYLSFGLYLIADNISVPTTILDFPLWDQFVEELKNGYTHVAISFIVPNVLKAKRMAEFIRAQYPDVTIMLGGYGSVIPDLEKIVPHDVLARGEGVTFMRHYFNEPVDAPLKHPVLRNPVYSRVYGVSSTPRGSVLMTGAGCKNGCTFCVTSHMFNKQYIPLLKTGQDVFNACETIERELKVNNFMVMDENFLMHEERAREMLKLMEEHDKTYVFVLFCSANIIKRLGVDFFVRMGISRVWIGVESMTYEHEKVRGIDVKKLIAELRAKGIAVLASTILFQDHHDYPTIKKEIEWVNDLDSDMVQFMNYTAIPSTALYHQMIAEDRMLDVPYERQSGALELVFDHPHIKKPAEHIQILKDAFTSKYETGGPAVARMTRTALRGYEQGLKDLKERKERKLNWNPETLKYEPGEQYIPDLYFESRLERIKEEAVRYRPLLKTARLYAPNKKSKKEITDTLKMFDRLVGKMSFKEHLQSGIVKVLATRELIREKKWQKKGHETIIHQPPTYRTTYRQDSIQDAKPGFISALEVLPEG